MSTEQTILDENTLAAYLADTLSADERAAVTRALVRDPEARELVRMALRALRAADRPSMPSASVRDADERVTRQPRERDGRRSASSTSQD